MKDYVTSAQRLNRKPKYDKDLSSFFGFDLWTIAMIALATFALADMLCFYAWIMSGQTPMDGFYLGMFTAKIVGLFI